MKAMLRRYLRFIAVSAVALVASAASFAQSPEQAEYPRFSQAELDQILAPIALYPDSLLSQLLMAATYPRDVVEAAAWSRDNPGWRGDEAVRAVDNQRWDPSVKSMVAFPQILAMMDERMEWTERLGDAFMSSPEQVSDTIQVLRGRADEAGNLRSGEEIVVRRDYGHYVIEPAAPEVVYVPYYDPRVVYGRWWWPDYEPVYWSPWVGYRWTPGYSGFGWGLGITLGSGFWYSTFDWPRHYIRFYGNRPHYYRGYSRYHGHRWYSDRDHRRNVRNWQWSGDRRGDGRRDWDRGDRRRDGRDGYGRDPGRRVDRAPAPSGRENPATAPDSRYVPGAATEQRRAAPRAPTAPLQSYGGQPVERASRAPTAPLQSYGSQPVERTPQRAYAPRSAPAPSPIARPDERQAPAARAPVPQAPTQSYAPVARQPRSAPAPAPVERSESRSESRSDSRSDRSSDERSSSGGGGRPQRSF